MAKDTKMLQALKDGNFTIAYHDNGYCEIFSGKHEYDDLTELDDRHKLGSFDASEADGYIPAEVAALVKALGGKAVTT
jgi:hypothetical protein